MSSKQPVGVIGAMDSELSSLIAALKGREDRTLHGLVFYTGTLEDSPVVLVKCGVGKVNAARTAQVLIDAFAPRALINTGIAGGVAPGLSVGDAVVADGLVQHDFDVTAFGHAKGYLCTGRDSSKPTVFVPEQKVQDSLFQAACALLGEGHVHRGMVATGDQFISGRESKAAIWEQFHASAAEMEGGAIAQAAALTGVPFGVIRVISDLADGTAPSSFDQFEQETADRSAAIVKRTLALL